MTIGLLENYRKQNSKEIIEEHSRYEQRCRGNSKLEEKEVGRYLLHLKGLWMTKS